MKAPLSLFVAFFLFLSNVTVAEQPATPLIVIAADQSDSMHMQTNTDRNIHVQTKAIVAAIDRYVENCSQVRVSYMAWGSSVSPPVNFWLHDQTSRSEFAAVLRDQLSRVRKGFTFHHPAMEKAINHAASVAAPTSAIIFLTDEKGNRKVDDLELPPNTRLFKISLGSQGVSDYVTKDFMPGVGFHYHAETIDELTPVISDVFTLMTTMCLG